MKTKFLTTLLILFGLSVFSQTDNLQIPKLGLNEVLKYALSNNEDIKKAILDENSAEYRIKEVRGAGLPQLNAYGQFNYFPALATQLLPGELAGQPGTMIPVQFGTKYSATGGLELQQLFFSKSLFIGLEAASTAREFYDLRKQLTQEEVIYNVSSAYLQLLQTKEQFNTVNANMKRLQQLEEILNLQYQNDIVTKVQLNRVKVNLSNIENLQQNLAATYQQQLNGLKFFMNMPISEALDIQDEAEELDKIIVEDIERVQFLDERLDYKLLNKQHQLNTLNIKNVKAEYYPTLSGFVNANYNAQRNEFNFFESNQSWFNAVTVGLSLNIPLFDGFQRSNRIKQAEVELEKTNYDLNKLRQNATMEIENAITQINTSLSNIKAQEENVELAIEVYENTNEIYTEGLAPLTDLLDVELSLREAETNLNNEKLRYQIAQLNLLRAKGNLNTLIQ